MKATSWFAITLVVGIAATAHAQVGGVGTIMKDKARGFTNSAATRGTEQQPLMPTQPKRNQPAPTPAKAAAPQAPKLTDAQAVFARKLQADLNEIKPKSTATANQVQVLMQDLMKSAQGKTPAMGTLMKLAGDLAAGWPGQKMDDKEKTQFAENVVHLLNSGGLPAAESQKLLQNTELILKYSGMPNVDAQKILAGLKTAVTQVK